MAKSELLPLKSVTQSMLRSLGRSLIKRHLVLPRFAPNGWSECDLFELTKAGYFREYELKTTRPDFFDDKHKTVWIRGERRYEIKHELMIRGFEKGPRQFWFVVPEGLVDVDELPAFAGLIYVTGIGMAWPRAREIRKAPPLHRKAADPKIRDQLFTAAYWRFANSQLAGSCPVEHRGTPPPFGGRNHD